MNIERLDLLKDMYYHPTLGGEYLQPPTEYEMKIVQKLNEIIDKLNQKDNKIHQLTNNWNELEEYLLEYKVCMTNDERDYYEDGIKDCLDEVLDTMKEIKEQSNDKS